ncbi:hypothetical protein K2173_021115 [Erythroxylum novogranatense]|uniref:Exostosin GT47 domain-containing protein n=1 Tax=Erythroxylum novogranatense TaxID=1862640 RepID=A0AAV8TMM1_9ROSI|nr:hypothetical protein K2173_021115 [Erythroxylum novogranatense]
MEKPTVCRTQLWFVVFTSFPLFVVLFYALDFSTLNGQTHGVSLVLGSFASALNVHKPVYNGTTGISEVARNVSGFLDTTVPKSPDGLNPNHIDDPCTGRYVYVHDLPSRFNRDILSDCKSLVEWYDMCPYVKNMGLGPQVKNHGKVLMGKSWFSTNQFLLEVIFHNRMKSYECLTEDSSMASAIFVPVYAGLDIGRYLWNYSTSVRDSLALDLVEWLREKPEWKRVWGRDHFFVAGRISWDFHRLSNKEFDWGSKLMTLPESMNLTMLSIEATSWSNEFAIPYPAYFHPSTEAQVLQWQKRMRRRKRRYLFSFAGAPRPNMGKSSVRAEIIRQCLASGSHCKLLDCNSSERKCENPEEVIKVFQDSIFCLQPPGDSYTRRSTFDSILAGCIPVFFHPASAYAQYTWYFPKNYTAYSVFMTEKSIKQGNLSISRTLQHRVSKREVSAMREEIISLIPKLLYANPKSKLDNLEDAFDIAVNGVLKRVEEVRRVIKEGRDPSVGFAEENSWKLKLSGIGSEQEWDQFF